MEDAPEFIEDGHVFNLKWVKDKVFIHSIFCPFDNPRSTSMCNRLRNTCVIQSYAAIYGTEINIGSVTLDQPVEVAWAPVAGSSEVDREFSMVWVIPVKDPDYLSYKIDKSLEEGPSGE